MFSSRLKIGAEGYLGTTSRLSFALMFHCSTGEHHRRQPPSIIVLDTANWKEARVAEFTSRLTTTIQSLIEDELAH